MFSLSKPSPSVAVLGHPLLLLTPVLLHIQQTHVCRQSRRRALDSSIFSKGGLIVSIASPSSHLDMAQMEIRKEIHLIPLFC
jgi:hypothetical protein